MCNFICMDACVYVWVYGVCVYLYMHGCIYVWVYCVCMCVRACIYLSLFTDVFGYLYRSKESVKNPEGELQLVVNYPVRAFGMNSGPLQDQCAS